MTRQHLKPSLVVLAAGAVYLALIYFLVGPAFVVAPGFEWMKETLGPLAGTRVWSHSVHAAALIVSATPSAAILLFGGTRRLVALASVTGVLTALAAFLPTFIHQGMWPYLSATFFAHAVIDGIKTVLILVLVAWLMGKLPSNYAMQRSSRVVTPLAGTGISEGGLRPASGAPNARRR